MNRLILPYTIFCERICDIEQYINKTMKKTETLAKLEELVEKEDLEYIIYLKSLPMSTIQYNAIVISLYGCFENYIDKLSNAYTNLLLETALSYSDLPESFQHKFRIKVGDFLASPHRFNAMDLNFETVVHDYANLIDSNFSEITNTSLVTYHSGNMRALEVFEMMNALGITNGSANTLNSYCFKQSIKELFDMEETEYLAKARRANANIKDSEIYAPLEKLVEQRNCVAHGWSEGERIDVHDLLNTTIPFLQIFSKNILRLCLIASFKNFEKRDIDFKNPKPIKVIRNHVLCINNQNNRIAKGDFILYKSNSQYKCSEILNIQVNGEDVSLIEENVDIAVGLLLDDTVKKTDRIYFVISTEKNANILHKSCNEIVNQGEQA